MTEPFPEHAANATDNDTDSPANATTTVSTVPTIQRWLQQLYLEHDYHEDSLSITVGEFLRMLETADTCGKDSGWLTDDQLTLPMVLQLNKQIQRSDMVIIPPSAASSLASIGIGQLNTGDFASLAPGLYKALNEEKSRWVVVPCNDGMLIASEVGMEAQETAEENAEERADSNRSGQQDRPAKVVGRRGIHWGLMIIDKKSGDARFFDGALSKETKASKCRMRSSYPQVAVAAGKILCGYDQVTNKPKGHFRTGTIRHTPHDRKDNIYRGDVGSACAPWVFAMFRYILQQQGFLTYPTGLKGVFEKRRKPEHVNRLKFNSWNIRHEMQDLIAEQASRKDGVAGLPPHKLDLAVLQQLGTYNPEQLLDLLHSLEGSNDAPRRKGRFSKRVGGRPGGSDDGDDSDYNNDLDVQRVIAESLKTAGNNQAQVGHNGKPADKEVPASAAHYAALQVSAAFKAVVNEVIDFMSMEEAQVDEWLRKNPSLETVSSDLSPWLNRLNLQKSFGGIDEFTIGKAAAAQYRTIFGLDSTLSHLKIVDVLQGLTRDVPDLRGKARKYPEYFLRERGLISALPVRGTKRQSSTEATASTKRVKLSSRDFLHMDEQTLDLWIEKMPPDFRKQSIDEFRARVWLERMYGDGFEYMRESSKESLRTLRKWKSASKSAPPHTISSLNKFLLEELLVNPIIDGKIVTIPDLRGELEKEEVDQEAMVHGEDYFPASTDLANSPDLSEPPNASGAQATPRAPNAHDEGEPSSSPLSSPPDSRSENSGLSKDRSPDSSDSGKSDSVAGGGGIDGSAASDAPTDRHSDPDTVKDKKLPGVGTVTSINTANTAGVEVDIRSWENPHELPKGLHDFRTMSHEELKTHMDPASLNDPRLFRKNPGNTSWRAFLFVTRSGRHFEEESDGNCLNLWLYDTLVFSPEERETFKLDRGRAQEIRDRMNYYYYTGPASKMPVVNGSETEEEPDDEQPISEPGKGPETKGKKRFREQDGDYSEKSGFTSKKSKVGHETPADGPQNEYFATASRPVPTRFSGQSGTESAALIPEATASSCSDTTVEDPTINIRIGSITYIFTTNDRDIFLPLDTAIKGWPRGATSLPDFANMPLHEVAEWQAANYRWIRPLLRSNQNSITTRALLHLHFRRTFLHEPDENFSTVWLGDRNVFSLAEMERLRAIENATERNGEIRRCVMAVYEPEMLRRIEQSGLYRPGLPEIEIIAASRKMVVEETLKSDKARLMVKREEAQEAIMERRRRDEDAVRRAESGGLEGLRRSTRKKTPARKYQG